MCIILGRLKLNESSCNTSIVWSYLLGFRSSFNTILWHAWSANHNSTLPFFFCSAYFTCDTLSWNGMCLRGVNLYGLSVSRMDFCDLHGLTGLRCNPYGYLWFLQIHTYNQSSLYIRTVVSLQWHHLCFMGRSMLPLLTNREHENKVSVSQQVMFCLLLYMGVLQRDPMPKLCFVMVLTSCKDFLQIVRIVCHDLTDMSCAFTINSRKIVVDNVPSK